MRLPLKLWAWWQLTKWVLEGRPCRCGADFKGHKPRSVTWCVYNDAKVNRDVMSKETGCTAVIFHGPGHQSKTTCEVEGPHEVHQSTSTGRLLEWIGDKGCTDYFDECRPV